MLTARAVSIDCQEPVWQSKVAVYVAQVALYGAQVALYDAKVAVSSSPVITFPETSFTPSREYNQLLFSGML